MSNHSNDKTASKKLSLTRNTVKTLHVRTGCQTGVFALGGLFNTNGIVVSTKATKGYCVQ